MATIVITAEVNDGVEWEPNFRTHGDLFREQTVISPVSYAVSGNDVSIQFNVEDLDTFLQILDSQATADAMNMDGVKHETVKVYLLDKTLQL
jgi:hypothetical protein